MPIPKIAITAALTVANMAMTMSRKIEGPRVDDLDVTLADYGTPVPRIWGMRRIEGCPIFWAEPINEVKRESKTKGGKYNNYTYFGTWAVKLACHEIDGITRLWFDKHLVLDLTGEGPITPFPIGYSAPDKKGTMRNVLGAAFGVSTFQEHFALYTGSETQEPDERIRTTTEAAHGAGSTSAHRGMAYIVFKDIPLEKFGNRIPQVSAEIVAQADTQYLQRTIATETQQPARLWGFTFSADGSRFMWGTTTQYEVFDTLSLQRITHGSWPVEMALQATFGMYESGDVLVVGEVFPFAAPQKIYRFDADLVSYSEVFSTSSSSLKQQGTVVVRDGLGGEHWGTIPYSINTAFLWNGNQLALVDLIGVTSRPAHYFASVHGDVWLNAASPSGGAISTARFYRLVDAGVAGGPGYITAAGLAAWTAAGGRDFAAVHYADDETDQFVFHWPSDSGDMLYAVDSQTGAVLHSRSLSIDVYNQHKQFVNCRPGATTIWLNSETGTAREISLKDLTTVRSFNLASGPWGAIEADGMIYEPVNHALITAPQSDDEITVLFLDRIAGAGTTLGAIVNEVCQLGGAAADEIDTTDLTQEVIGYSVGRGSGKDWLEPLLDTFDSFARPHDFDLQFRQRGSSSGGTLSFELFAERPDRDGIYGSPRMGGSDLPSAVTLIFADVDADQQPNQALSGPLEETGSNASMRLDMGSLALDVDTARQLAARFHRRVVFERLPYELDLTAQQLALEPGDVRTLSLPGGKSALVRLESAVLGADRRIATEWRADDPSLALLDGAAGAGFDGRTPSVIVVPSVSRGHALDIPLLRDADNDANPLLYLAAGPYGDGFWPGAAMLREQGGEYSDSLASIGPDSAVTWGTTTNTLGSADPAVWDRGRSVNIVLQSGTLVSSDEATVDALPTTNLLLLGSELLNFTTATLQGDGSWTISGLKRGRRGTEWAVATHAVGEIAVLMGAVTAAELGLSDLGVEQRVKAVTEGRSASGAYVASVDFTGATLKPYSPVQLRAVPDGSDWDLSWVRRTRVGGAWTGGTTIPLSENSEEYELEILDGATVVRTVTGLSSPAWTYSAADQTTDFGAPLAEAPSFRVYQISDAVGRGFVATA